MTLKSSGPGDRLRSPKENLSFYCRYKNRNANISEMEAAFSCSHLVRSNNSVYREVPANSAH